MLEVRELKGAIGITVRVIPRSSRNQIIGEYRGALKVKLTSPPVAGAANRELIILIAKKFKIAKRNVAITAGKSSKTKSVQINGISIRDFREVFSE